MFTFRCAGCGKQHFADEPFAEDYSTRCLRCGESIRVTGAIAHPVGAGVPSPGRSGPWDEGITAAVPEGAADSAEEVADPPAEETADGEQGFDDEDGETLTPGTPGSRARKRGKRQRREVSEEQWHEEGSDTSDDEPQQKPQSREEADRIRRRRIMLIAGVVALFLALVGGGAYLVLGRAKPPKAPDRASRTHATKKSAAPAAPSTEKAPDKPVVKPPETDVRIAATRLAAELATNATAANQKYRGKLLEVSGLVGDVKHKAPVPLSDKPPAQPASKPLTAPVHDQLRFLCEAPPIVCNLDDSPTDINTWRGLQSRKPITVRGIYGTDGILQHCVLLPLAAPADARFKSKEVEVAGFIKSVTLSAEEQFPWLLLEGDTDSFTNVQCLFRFADRDELRKLSPGTPVVVHGTCAGRVEDRESVSGRRGIRLDNCQLVDTTAPRPSIERVSAIEMIRAYEEDLRPVFVPAPGEEQQVPGTVTTSQIYKAWSADRLAFVQKYRSRVVTVSGKLFGDSRDGSALVLISGNTDEPLQVHCRFDRAALADLSTELKSGAEYRVRGRCTGMPEGLTWTLESCQAADSSILRSPQRLTADFLPHQPGQQLTYDIAEYPVPGKKEGPVRRLLFLQREDGRTESIITHTGTLSGADLFDGGDAGQWVSHKKTLAARLPGPVYFQRISGGFVEIGQPALKRDRTSAISWRPVLKLGTRTGDTWKWPAGNVTHSFLVEKFDEWRGRPRVFVTETVTNVADPVHAMEKHHVYVRDVGEIEQRDWLLITSKDRVLVGEKRLVEDQVSKPNPMPELLGRPSESPAR